MYPSSSRAALATGAAGYIGRRVYWKTCLQGPGQSEDDQLPAMLWRTGMTARFAGRRWRQNSMLRRPLASFRKSTE